MALLKSSKTFAKASSLLESLVALTIVSMCIGIGIVVFVGTTKTQSRYLNQLEVENRISHQIFLDWKSRSFDDDVILFQGKKIVKNVSRENDAQWLKVDYSCVIASKTIHRTYYARIDED